MDFGIALVTQGTQSRVTPRGAMIGTFRYMAPEQFKGAEFALGHRISALAERRPKLPDQR